MGTRGSVGFIYQEKENLAYNHFDSYPEGLGADVLEIIVKINKEEGWEKFKKNAIKLKNVEGDITDQKLIKKYEKYSNLGVSKKELSDPYCLFREIQGSDWLNEVYTGELEDYTLDNKFIKESLFCEYAYVINLDTMKLEFYNGFQKVPQVGNRFGNELVEGYYPCRLVGVFTLSDIIDSDAALNLVERMQKILETEVDDHTVMSYFRKPKMEAINEKSLEI